MATFSYMGRYTLNIYAAMHVSSRPVKLLLEPRSGPGGKLCCHYAPSLVTRLSEDGISVLSVFQDSHPHCLLSISTLGLIPQSSALSAHLHSVSAVASCAFFPVSARSPCGVEAAYSRVKRTMHVSSRSFTTSNPRLETAHRNLHFRPVPRFPKFSRI